MAVGPSHQQHIAGGLVLVASLGLAAIPVWYWGEADHGGWQLALATVVLLWVGLGAHTIAMLGAAVVVYRKVQRPFSAALIALAAVIVCAACMVLSRSAERHPMVMGAIATWALLCGAFGVRLLWLRHQPLPSVRDLP